MNNLLLTTAYFPPISYFSAITQATQVTIEQYENFGKQSYRNRCNIMAANGVLSLTVPVVKANSKTLTKDLKITYATPWQKLHFKGIESAYKNSPYYEYYIDDIEPFFRKQEAFLLDLNQGILNALLKMLGIGKEILLTTDYVPAGTPGYTDLRDAIHPKKGQGAENMGFPVRPYRQVFCDRTPFVPDLSILDMLFCCGPATKEML